MRKIECVGDDENIVYTNFTEEELNEFIEDTEGLETVKDVRDWIFRNKDDLTAETI